MNQVRGKHPRSKGRRSVALSGSLVTAVLGADYATPRQAPKPLPKRGPAPANKPRPGAHTKEPDAVILEVRRLHEQDGLGPAKIATLMTSLGVQMDRERARKITEYASRAHLIPTPGAKPYFTGEAPCTTSTPSAD